MHVISSPAKQASDIPFLADNAKVHARKELFLAVDAGGTKSDCMIARGDGLILALGSYRKPGLSGRSPGVIYRSIRAALKSVPPEARRFNLCFPWPYKGGKTCDLETPRKRDPNELPPREYIPKILKDDMIRRIFGISEWDSALALHGLHEGIVALGGTGAFVHVQIPSRNAYLHLDGYGPLIGDRGGAYQIGLLAFRAAATAHWSERRHTTLRKVVFDALEVGSLREAIRLSLQHLDRSLLASLAPLVEIEAAKGDAIARSIIVDAADSLAETLYDAISSRSLFDVEAPLVGMGSIATHCLPYWERFRERVREFAPGLQPVTIKRPPVLGMIIQGMSYRFQLTPEGKTALAEQMKISYDRFKLISSPTF